MSNSKNYNSLKEKVINDLCQCPYYWNVDFDYKGYLPQNWEEMSAEQHAEWVIDNGDWCLEEWIEYLEDFGYEYNDVN